VLAGKHQGPLRAWVRGRRIMDWIAIRAGVDAACRCARRGRPAVNGYSPGDARQKGAFIVEVLPSAIAMELQEGLLDCVFSVVGVEQDGISHAKDKPRLTLDERGKVGLFVRGQVVCSPSC